MIERNEKVLDSDEKVLWAGKPEPGPVLAVGAIWYVFTSAFVASMSYLFVSIPQPVLYGFFLVLGVVSAVHFWLAATHTQYIITDKSVKIHDGGIRPVEAEIRTQDVTHVDIEKGVIESLLNSGRIEFSTKDGSSLALTSLKSPKKIGISISDNLSDPTVDSEVQTSTQVTGVTWPRSSSSSEE